MRDIDERGMRTVMEEALRAAGRGTAGYHVSLDMDWIDPEDAPGVGTPVRGGATYREAHLAMEIMADHGGMLSFEMVEVNPVIDEHNRTAELAVELTARRLGKRFSSTSIQNLTLDKLLRRSVFGIYEDDVFGVAARRVDGEDDEWFLEEFAGSVDRTLLEEDELAWPEFEWRLVGEEEPSPS